MKIRTLVIDDEPTLTRILARVIGEDHEVASYNSAHDAITAIRAGARYDVILCDLMMPQMTGMDFHAELVRTLPAQAERVVFMTGGAFTPRAREFLEQVENARIDKPFDLAALRARIAALIARP